MHPSSNHAIRQTKSKALKALISNGWEYALRSTRTNTVCRLQY